jgi:hypothetical protein
LYHKYDVSLKSNTQPATSSTLAIQKLPTSNFHELKVARNFMGRIKAVNRYNCGVRDEEFRMFRRIKDEQKKLVPVNIFAHILRGLRVRAS